MRDRAQWISISIQSNRISNRIESNRLLRPVTMIFTVCAHLFIYSIGLVFANIILLGVVE